MIDSSLLHPFFFLNRQILHESTVNTENNKYFSGCVTLYDYQDCQHYSIVHSHNIFKMSGVINRINEYILSGSKSLKGPTMAALIS